MFIAMLIASVGLVGVQAQYVDVTSTYLANAGFDSGITYSGTEDVTSLGSANGGANIAVIEGWPTRIYGDNSAAGIFGFGCLKPLNYSTAGCIAPATDADGNSVGGVLGISSAWGANNYYGQTVTLPIGKYKITYATYNSGPVANANKSSVAWVPTSGTAVTATKANFALNAWETDSFTFIVKAETEGVIRVGLGSNNVGSGAVGRVFFDYVKLEFDGSISAEDKAALIADIAAATLVYGDGSGNGAAALLTAIETAQAVVDNPAVTFAMLDDAVLPLFYAVADYNVANASANNPANLTFKIVNPNFDTDISGWTVVKSVGDPWKIKGGFITGNCMEVWRTATSAVDFRIATQAVQNLPAGKYKLSAKCFAADQNTAANTNQGSVNLLAGAFTTSVAIYDYETVEAKTEAGVKASVAPYSVIAYLGENSDLTIGYFDNYSNANWIGIDDFQLEYLGTLSAAEEALRVVFDKATNKLQVASNYTDVALYNAFKAAYVPAMALVNGGGSDEDFAAATAALDAAITAANASVALKERNTAIMASTGDITFIIANPNFDDGVTGWSTNMATYDGDNTKWSGWDKEYTTVPGTNKVLDKGASGVVYGYQSFANMPAGYYVMKAIARGQSLSPSNMFFFVNDGTDHLNTAGTVEKTTTVNRIGDGTAPLNFGWARYITEFTASASSTITIGMRADNGATSRWQSADAFKLYRYESQAAYRCADASAIKDKAMNATVKSALEAAMAADWANLSTEDYAAAIATLDAAIVTAEASIAEYAKLNTAIVTAETSAVAEDAAVVAAIATAKGVYSAGAVEAAGIDAAITDLKKVVSLATAATITNGDYTSLIVNPTILQTAGIGTRPNGWEQSTSTGTNGNFTKAGGTVAAPKDTYLEAWGATASAIVFDYNQTVYVPNGLYRLGAATFTQATNGNAVLYANEVTTPLKTGVTGDNFVQNAVNTELEVTVTDNTLRLGIKTIGEVDKSWHGADFFVLTIDAEVLTASKQALTDSIAVATGLTDPALAPFIVKAEMNELTRSIALGTAALSSDVISVVKLANDTVNSAIADAKTSIKLSTEMMALVTEAATLFATNKSYTKADSTALQTVINTQMAMWAAQTDATDNVVLAAAKTELSTALAKFKMFLTPMAPALPLPAEQVKPVIAGDYVIYHPASKKFLSNNAAANAPVLNSYPYVADDAFTWTIAVSEDNADQITLQQVSSGKYMNANTGNTWGILLGDLADAATVSGWALIDVEGGYNFSASRAANPAKLVGVDGLTGNDLGIYYDKGTDKNPLFMFYAKDDFFTEELAAYVDALNAYNAELAIFKARQALQTLIETAEASEYAEAMAAAISAAKNVYNAPEATLADINAASKAIKLATSVAMIASVTDRNYTVLIVNPTIMHNAAIKVTPTGWENSTNSGTNGNFTKEAGTVEAPKDTYLEAWNATASTMVFDYNQTIILPNGVYQVGAATFTEVTNGNAVLYGNEVTTPLKVGAGFATGVGNEQTAINTSLSVAVTNNELRLGIKTIGTLDKSWSGADFFTLTYLGTSAEYIKTLSDSIAVAKALKTSAVAGTIVKAELAKLNTAITSAEAVVTSAVVADVPSAITGLVTAMKDANTSISLCFGLDTLFTKAQALLTEYHPAVDGAALQTVLTAKKDLYANQVDTTSNTVITAACTELAAAIEAYLVDIWAYTSVAEIGIDGVEIFVSGSSIIVEGAEYELYTEGGIRVANDAQLIAGIYIVKIGDKSIKVQVN